MHKWQFDEGAGQSAGDSVGAGTGTLTGGAAYAPGRLGNAVAFDGVDDAVSTTAVPRTDQDFTVSAWVQLTSNQCPTTRCKRVAVSQDGDRNSKFRLGFVKDRDHPYGNWLFEMPETDTDTTRVTVAAVSAESSDFGADVWVHLVGVYDRSAGRVLLFVNGNRVGEGAVRSTWQAGGGVQLGRGRLAGVPAEPWTGRVDDVRVLTGSLPDEGVFALYASYPTADQPAAQLPAADRAHWKMEEKSGATAADSSGQGRTLTFTGASGWIGGRTGGGAWLDGSTASGETAGPVVRTDRSFSVAAWVYLDGDPSGDRAVLAQEGTRASAFSLQYRAASRKWAVTMTSADQDNPTTVLLESVDVAPAAKWTHVAAVYDADPTRRHLRLYVGGVLVAVRTGVVGWDATGPFTVGRHKQNGVKTGYFPRGIDDVRVFGRALTDGEVAEVHDDVVLNDFGLWRFDDNDGRDSTWRNNALTFHNGVSYVPGVIGNALKLEGGSSASTAYSGVNTRDSFTVSAWARLERDDRTYTVLSQDGTRVSGFVLQYRPESRRWVFAAPGQDADNAPLVQASSAEPARLWEWTHLAGVYDHTAGQLRLYVDGKQAGVVDARLWAADGALGIGRAKAKGGVADQFAGLIDEARIEAGIVPDDKLLVRGTYAAPAKGQLGRYVDQAGKHHTGSTDTAPPAGYRYEGTLGMPVPASHPNTRPLYACDSGTDLFTSAQADCEGATKVADIGRVYAVKPTNVPTAPLHRCVVAGDRFDSLSTTCEGQTKEQLLGYVLAYAPLTRYIATMIPWDHWSSVQGVTPGYRYEGVLGWVTTEAEPNTVALYACRTGTDVFSSLDPACEGGTKVSNLGRIWTAPPPGVSSLPLSRCLQSGTANRFDSTATCDGQQVQQRLGYVLASPPNTTTPTFPAA
ncbi:LamG domain-containing protein [Actinosynnema sp. NPDC004786]